MRLHALSVYTAVGLSISTVAMPTGPPPCHDESKAIPYKSLPYLTPPPQKSYTEKPYLPSSVENPYVAPLSPPPAPKVDNPKPEKSYPPAPAPKPYLEKPSPEEKTCPFGLYKRQVKSYPALPPPPPLRPLPYPDMTKPEEKPNPWSKTKLEKPKPDMKSHIQKQPYFGEKGKSDGKQKPQYYNTKASDKPTPQGLDNLGLSSQADSLVGSNSIELPADGHCLVDGHSTDGDDCQTELPHARRGISTVS
ncbi:hypothetical protein EI94DRAFT_1811396 [Lactarius quietus]|nr:hypothetical protein EI94DRAFT_1811396 [Lactarius quietus]